MNKRHDQLTVSLKKSWQEASPDSLQSNENVATLMDALFTGRFKFVEESWHGHDGEVAKELLLRAWDEKGVGINHADALDAIVNEGDLSSFNSFLVYKAFAKTPVQSDTSLSVNIFPSCAADKKFWDHLETSVGTHKNSQIIFEILEHEKDYKVDHSLMQEALNKGYRFALDDFEASPDDHKRLKDFAPYLSFVKLDGKLVREGLKDKAVLEQAISMLKTDYPDLKIVAEYVSNDKEATQLYKMGVSAVQGMSLPKNFKSDFRP